LVFQPETNPSASTNPPRPARAAIEILNDQTASVLRPPVHPQAADNASLGVNPPHPLAWPSRNSLVDSQHSSVPVATSGLDTVMEDAETEADIGSFTDTLTPRDMSYMSPTKAPPGEDVKRKIISPIAPSLMTVASPSMSPISKRPAEAVPVEKGCITAPKKKGFRQ
jgi:hypothetical protein